MAYEGTAWVDPDAAAWVRRLTTDADVDRFVRDYSKAGPDRGYKFSTPLRRVLEKARDAGATSVLIENRYVDADYRSEHAAFWSQRFLETSMFTRRLHFFAEVVDEQELSMLPAQSAYRGYAVLRPPTIGAVGRTMVAPSAAIVDYVTTACTDTVHVLGREFHVTAAPFLQQDREFLTCGLAAAWMCHYAGVQRGLVSRQLTAALFAAAPAILSQERAMPARGLDLKQVQAMFSALGQPALFYGMSQLPEVSGVPNPTPRKSGIGPWRRDVPHGVWDTRIESIACRYLSGGFPVYVATKDHAFVLVGWSGNAGEPIVFIANDDRQGPYLEVEALNRKDPWVAVMVPLPPKVFVPGEMAENAAFYRIGEAGRAATAAGLQKRLVRALEGGNIMLNSSLRRGVDYKAAIGNRGLDSAVADEIREARLPRFVWVVQAVAPHHRGQKSPVAAELVYDASSSGEDPRLLVALVPPDALVIPPDEFGGARRRDVEPGWSALIPT